MWVIRDTKWVTAAYNGTGRKEPWTYLFGPELLMEPNCSNFLFNNYQHK